MPTTAGDPSLSLRVFLLRGQRVVLDSDLSALYGVATKTFNQTIRRNAGRFPTDFVFQLTREEFARLISQIVISSPEGLRRLGSQFVTLKTAGRGRHRKYPPLASPADSLPLVAAATRVP